MNTESEFHQKYGPWALVAGASEGLGAAFAEQLARQGMNLVLVARRSETLLPLAVRLSLANSIQVRTLCLDLSADDTPALIDAETEGLPIGLVIYNAGYSKIGPFLQIPLEEHLREIDTNVRAPLEIVHLFANRMLAQPAESGLHGGIILLSSLSALMGSALISNYAATKAYNRVLGEGLWEELRSQGIDVLVSCPSSVSTPNYLKSLKNGRQSVPGMAPEAVAAETLAALGKRITITPGLSNWLQGLIMSRVLPRSVAIRLMGRVLRSMYS